ncbi:MSCRAMM family adhesin SdrC [Puniceicoccaceae bacterium K14]|nr:MSCRAMM family adhesin SdrC [Puniceicoccaceae bacterium K14]
MKVKKIALFAISCVPFLFSETKTVTGPIFIDTGKVLDVINNDDIETDGEVTIADGGQSVFWSSTKIVLKPGFYATPTGIGAFEAIIDSDFDGHSDTTEMQDSDGDGILDGFEYAIINANYFDAYDGLEDVSSSSDFDGDGQNDLSEYNGGTDAIGSSGVNYTNKIIMVLPGGEHRIVDALTLLSN